MARTIRWKHDRRYFESIYVDYLFKKDEWWIQYLRRRYGDRKFLLSHKKYSRFLRSDGRRFCSGGKSFYKWKRNHQRRAFERQELHRTVCYQEHFYDLFEGGREWMD